MASVINPPIIGMAVRFTTSTGFNPAMAETATTTAVIGDIDRANELLICIGIITEIASTSKCFAGVVPIAIFMQALISIATVLMGSGDAAIFSFMGVGAIIAEHFDVEAISVIMPMQISSSLARSMSPITAVVVAVSAIAGLNPVDVVKRTAIPMIGGLITLAIVNAILFL